MNKKSPTTLLPAIAVALIALPFSSAYSKSYLDDDISELMNVNITGASGFVQKANEAPSAITVITGREIKDFGWTTLGKVLNSVRGFHTITNHFIVGTSIRGVAAPPESSRLTILIDGQKINDNLLEMWPLGTEFGLSMDMVDHIEVIRGPVAAIYGSNALYGAINVVTRKGADIKGVELMTSAGTWHTRANAVTFGTVLSNGADVLMSASLSDSRGQDFHFSEMNEPRFNNGWVRGADGEHGKRLFAKYAHGGLQLEGIWSTRNKDFIGLPWGTEFNNPGRSKINFRYFTARYSTFIDDKLELIGKLFSGGGDLFWTGVYPNVAQLGRIRADWTLKAWRHEAELRLVSTRWEDHHVSVALDWRDNRHQDEMLNWTSVDYNLPVSTNLYAGRNSSLQSGAAIQDDFVISEHWRASIGVRVDKLPNVRRHTSQRLGLVYTPFASGTLKLLYGEAFRAPNVAEAKRLPNDNLRPETIKNAEVAWEQYFQGGTRLTLGAYVFRIEDLIEFTLGDGYFYANRQTGMPGKGAELEIEQRFANGAMVRASLSRQIVSENIPGRVNPAPGLLAKLNLSSPLWQPNMRLGAEIQYRGRQPAILSNAPITIGHLGGAAITNVNLLWTPFPHTEVSLLATNVFDRKDVAPVPMLASENGAFFSALPQERRRVTLKLVQRF